MPIQKKLFTLHDSWPWVLIAAIILGLSTAGLIHNWNDKAAMPQLIFLGLVNLVFMSAIEYRYKLRYLFVDTWNKAFQTSQGIAVLPQAGLSWSLSFKGIRIDNVFYNKIDLEITKSADFWGNWFTTNRFLTQETIKEKVTQVAAISKITAALSGCSLIIGTEPPTVNFIGKVMGYTDGINIVVTFDGDKVKTMGDLLQLIRHEVSHICLTSLGIDAGYAGASHHVIFEQTGFC
jgi:hypothetical protein